MANKHGDWIWYELMTPDAVEAHNFYQAVVGWKIDFEPGGDMDYRMITGSEGLVGGVLGLSGEMIAGGAHPGWIGYINVEDVDKMATSVERGGGKILMPAHDTPEVGRIAMLADPQGAAFYVMKPTPPADNPDKASNAFAAERSIDGHCAWNELATSDSEAALHFYGSRFGWVKDGEMDMGPMGKYHFIKHGAVTGAIMPKMPDMPISEWTFYFRVADIDAAAIAVIANGGQVVHGPIEVPGGDFSMNAMDPQGAMFALVGKRKG
jgi:uncharacterized protein